MPMSALRRLLSIAAIATGARETTPNEAAKLAANEQLSTLNPPEIQPSARNKATLPKPRNRSKPCDLGRVGGGPAQGVLRGLAARLFSRAHKRTCSPALSSANLLAPLAKDGLHG